MAIGMSGLVSGLDTETIVSALVSGYKTKKDDMTKEQTKLEWKMDAWKDLNKKVYSMYSKSLSNLRFSSGYIKKATSISDSTIAKITAGSSSVNGTQTLAVKQLAKSGYLTGGKVSNVNDKSSKITASSTLADLGITDSASFVVGAGDSEKTITVDGTTSVSALVKKLQDAGVNASFDEKNQRFFVSSKESGADNDFTILANNYNGSKALSALGLSTKVSDTEIDNYKKWAAYTDADFATAKQDAIESAYASSKTTESAQKTALTKEITTLNNQDTAIYQAKFLQELKAGLTSASTSEDIEKALSDKETYLKTLVADETDETKKEEYRRQLAAFTSLKSGLKSKNGSYSYDTISSQLDKVEKSITLTEADYDKQLAANAVKRAKNTEIINDADKLKEYTDDVNAGIYNTVASDVSKNCDERRELSKAFMAQYNYSVALEEAKKTNGTVDAQIEKAYNESVAKYDNLLGTSDNGSGNGATRVNGQDAIIYLNGAKFENNDNTFLVNGLTITATEVTGVNEDGSLKTVSLTTSDDTDAIYDSIRDFLTEYNSIINEMDKLYNADSSKGYEPLTDDEKSELSDDEIEKWETKIKDSLLKGDTTLNSVAQAMKNVMQQGFTVNGKTMYLSNFGIGTLSYFTAADNEKSALHIDGDEEDSATSANADKLKSMIANDPDTVVSFFTQLSNSLYKELTNKMSATDFSSTYTLYNDKQMQSEYSQYTKKIAEQETKITWWENYYYSQFTAMEKALSSLNSQQSALSGLLGS